MSEVRRWIAQSDYQNIGGSGKNLTASEKEKGKSEIQTATLCDNDKNDNNEITI
jgi:hypothetical protein